MRVLPPESTTRIDVSCFPFLKVPVWEAISLMIFIGANGYYARS